MGRPQVTLDFSPGIVGRGWVGERRMWEEGRQTEN
jgi:hypothetical protein